VGTSRCLFGLAPAGVYRAAIVANHAVSSYLAISPLPNLRFRAGVGGVFSVALSVSLRSRPHNKPRCYLAARPMEPGLSSADVACNLGRDHPVSDEQQSNKEMTTK